MKVQRYDSSLKELWDRFVQKSKNGTFLFLRDYMDYHSDRFPDHSLVIWNDKESAIALLPASINESGTLTSHAGLTYGGFIVDETMKTALMMKIFDEVLQYLATHGVNRVIYKVIPHIYHSIPAEEDRYCLFLLSAELIRCDVLTVIDYCHIPPCQARRKRSIRKALQNGIEVIKTEDYESFWQILQDSLATGHNVNPVHTLAEIKLLAFRFPEHIQLFGAFQAGTMMAGTVLYLSQNVCHLQYVAANEAGKRSGAMDLITEFLIGQYGGPVRYLDFGISTEDNGWFLNRGLVDYKEGFGGRTVVHEHFKLDLTGVNTIL